MNTCPKCQIGRMEGPTYWKNAFGRECLRYRCSKCGYTATTPCADREEKFAARIAKAQGMTE
jgi:hypothetical protein